MVCGMTARDRFTWKLKCPKCKLVGIAHLSQNDGYSYLHDSGTTIDQVPAGFSTTKGYPDPMFECGACKISV